MNIRKRLRYSYILMLLIPIVLLMLSGSIINHIYSDDSNDAVLSQDFLKLIYETMALNPDLLLKKELLIELDSISGYKGKTNIFVDKENVLVNSLVNNHRGKHRNDHDTYNLVSHWEFYFSDNTTGYVTINIYDAALIKKFVLSGTFALIIAIGILILTNGFLSFYVARSILKPLKILETSALNIKNEDLDTPVIYEGKDEFLDVCIAFEEMRIRLKDSLYEQIKYEENRKELLSNISHDLKTPITAIKGYIEGIKDGIADTPEKVDKYINTVYSKTILMNDLIDRLFLFSKLDLKKVQFNFQKININTFLRDIIEEMKFDYPDLRITLAEKDSPLFVTADSIHLHRVITNLIDNSAKYGEEGSTRVDINLHINNDMVEVNIHDNGLGISEEALPHIFERFYRSDPARSSQREGTGLGLSISYQIIIAHGGQITAESSLGQGTTIKFTLRRFT